MIAALPLQPLWFFPDEFRAINSSIEDDSKRTLWSEWSWKRKHDKTSSLGLTAIMKKTCSYCFSKWSKWRRKQEQENMTTSCLSVIEELQHHDTLPSGHIDMPKPYLRTADTKDTS